MSTGQRPWALVTGASSGIGKELAREFLENGFDVLAVADSDLIYDAVAELDDGARVGAYQCDLATRKGVEALCEHLRSSGRPLAAAAINAGVGVGGRFLQNSLDEELSMIALNVSSVVHLTKYILADMVARGEGKILFTSSVAADTPNPNLAVYAATKAFVQSFAQGVRDEVKDTGVTITSLQPGPTETRFFERAHMEDTKVGAAKKDDPAQVARQGFKAMMEGKDHVVAGGLKNKLQTTMSKVLPEKWQTHSAGKQAEPRSAHH